MSLRRASAPSNFLPFLQWFAAYSRSDWKGDWRAGCTVGVLLVPQAMAYATIAGLPVVYGLYAALVPPLVYGFLGNSRSLAVGPVAMDSLLVAAGLSGLAAVGSDAYIQWALLLALMVGTMQWTMGRLKMGFLIHFLSRPVISGFTTAAALLIGVHQLPALLGIAVERTARLHVLLGELWLHFPSLHMPTAMLGLSSFGLMWALKKWAPQWPSALLLLVAGTSCSWFWGWSGFGILTVGNVPQGLPSFTVPSVSLGRIETLLPMAATLALVSFVEAMGVTKALATSTPNDVKPNDELKALGWANLLGSLFQGYPTSGGFSRSAVAHHAGAKTPAASWVAASVVGMTLLFLTPLFQHLPFAVLAAMIMVAVMGLVDVKYLRVLWQQDRLEAGILALTALVTLWISLPMGMAIGALAGLGVLVQRMMQPHVAELGKVQGVYRNRMRFPEAETDPRILIVRYDGPLTFANRAHFESEMERLVHGKGPTLQLIVLQADTISYIDATSRETIKALVNQWHQKGWKTSISGAIGPVRDALAKDGLLMADQLSFQISVDHAVQQFNQPGSVPDAAMHLAQQHSSSTS